MQRRGNKYFLEIKEKMNLNLIKSENGKILVGLVFVLVIVVLGIWGAAAYIGAQTLQELFAENKKLKQSITNLTKEDQIGYAKVVKQEKKNGKVYTTLKFVETARENKEKTILTKHYTVEGNIIHFDALIVKFNNKMVMDGKEKALYLWRRVYGEKMSPSQGFKIEKEGEEPERYQGLLGEQSFLDKILLKDDDTGRFWEEIWNLSDDPDKLKEYGITATYGNAVYKRLKPGLIYVFKITNTGQLYPETVPDM
jgi:hypothetical protein